jgi:hypothetical protein
MIAVFAIILIQTQKQGLFESYTAFERTKLADGLGSINMCAVKMLEYDLLYLIDLDGSFRPSSSIKPSVSTLIASDNRTHITFLDESTCTDNPVGCYSYCQNTCFRSMRYYVTSPGQEAYKLKVCSRTNKSRCALFKGGRRGNVGPHEFTAHIPTGQLYDAVFLDAIGKVIIPLAVEEVVEKTFCTSGVFEVKLFGTLGGTIQPVARPVSPPLRVPAPFRTPVQVSVPSPVSPSMIPAPVQAPILIPLAVKPPVLVPFPVLRPVAKTPELVRVPIQSVGLSQNPILAPTKNKSKFLSLNVPETTPIPVHVPLSLPFLTSIQFPVQQPPPTPVPVLILFPNPMNNPMLSPAVNTPVYTPFPLTTSLPKPTAVPSNAPIKEDRYHFSTLISIFFQLILHN